MSAINALSARICELKTLQARARVAGRAVPVVVLELDRLCVGRTELRQTKELEP